MTEKKSVSIFGFGRFGQLLASILKPDFDLVICDPARPDAEIQEAGFLPADQKRALTSSTIFYCVPISAFEEILAGQAPELQTSVLQGNKVTVIDVLSVKMHPRDVFARHLPDSVEAILTHPMFGPDTVRQKGLSGLKMVMSNFRAESGTFSFWSDYFEGKELDVIEMSPEEHDEMAANSQGLAHFVGRVLDEFGLEETPIDTLGAKKLHEVRALAANDTWQLFNDLQTLNPYTRKMRIRLFEAQSRSFNRLLPNRVHKDRLVVGIQGGRGSFNEEAARHYLKEKDIEDFELVYLHTSKNVLRALFEGEVDRGQFAIQNSIGGVVGESIDAMAAYRFNIVEEFGIKISHTLMVRPGVKIESVEKIMAHPQVFAQCRGNLDKKYPQLERVSGEGDLIDHAKVAELLGRGDLPETVATMGSKVLSQLNNLDIIEENLQDLASNFTTFLWVERQH
ncbi:MAG: prephenate dehydrogenase/arogenate dehydrogenase family protein [Cyanobacteria bacterium HKST-UBA02]|nr:prephenate dehydrogenase/arogenate dehydrogenase family protein [Cyanobacteria bacterium HKST-UBA02]